MTPRRGTAERRPGTLGRRAGASPGRPGVRAGRALRRGGAEVAALRSRLTGRAAVLVLVVAALLVSYASSLRAHLDQRGHLEQVREDIARSEREIAALEREKSRWHDPAYVEAQARARFAFGYPGEIGYQVLDEDGSPLDADSTLDVPAPEPGDGRPEWWESTLASIDAAARPPSSGPTPARRIGPPATDASPGGDD